MTLKESGIRNRVFIKTYGPSNGAKALARELGCKVLKNRNSKYRYKRGDVIINWGAKGFDISPVNEDNINNVRAIQLASNKLFFFEELHEEEFHDNLVSWLTDKQSAIHFLTVVPKSIIYCRKSLTGQAGSGIVIATKPEEVVDAPLYTVGIKKAREYRAHVSNRGIFHLQQKKRRANVEERQDGLIKNHGHGWVFCTENIRPIPDNTEDILVNMLRILGLDFAAFDFLVKDDTVYVLEANTAPGLEGTTVKKYSEEICAAIIGRNAG